MHAATIALAFAAGLATGAPTAAAEPAGLALVWIMPLEHVAGRIDPGPGGAYPCI